MLNLGIALHWAAGGRSFPPFREHALLSSQQSQPLVAMKTVLALIFDFLFFTLGCSPVTVYGYPPPLSPATQQLITWSHLFFHNVYYALDNTSFPCTITNVVDGVMVSLVYQGSFCQAFTRTEQIGWEPWSHAQNLTDVKILNLYLNGTITLNMFLVTSKSIGYVKQKTMSCPTFLVLFLACSKACCLSHI